MKTVQQMMKIGCVEKLKGEYLKLFKYRKNYRKNRKEVVFFPITLCYSQKGLYENQTAK